jgi:hypothetical protein
VSNLNERVAKLEVMLEELIKDQKEIMETQKELVKFVDKWKFASIALLGIGAFITQVVDWIVLGWHNLTTP